MAQSPPANERTTSARDPDEDQGERFAYVTLKAHGVVSRPAGIAVVDIAPRAENAGRIVSLTDAHDAGEASPLHWGAPDLTLPAAPPELPLCPAHNPTRAYAFFGVAWSPADFSAAVCLRYRECSADGNRGEWRARRVITIRARAAAAARLPSSLRGHGVVPPLVTHVALSSDDRWLYVSCWGTGELRRYDVTDPFNPTLTGLVRIGGLVRQAPHPGTPGQPRNGGPQSLTVSADGRRVFVTNALDPAWDDHFYPDGVRGWLAKIDTLASGGLSIDPGFLVEFEDGMRPYAVRLRDRSR